MIFKQLHIGQVFDFVNPTPGAYNSFFKRCVKISDRKYVCSDGYEHRVGTTSVHVFNVSSIGETK